MTLRRSSAEPPVQDLLAHIGEDRRTAPFTGWTRAHLGTLADELLLSVREFSSPDRSRVLIPAGDARTVSPMDGLEGFARSFMLAAFRLAGERGSDPLDFAEWYADGLAAGTDPKNPDRWPRPDEAPQAKVEAAALAVGLHFTRDWVWTRLSDKQQADVVGYLARVLGTPGPDTNWVWFRIVVEQFLASVGGPHDADDIRADLEAHERFLREDGWYADGVTRAFDYYNGWALQLYPFLWRQMGGGDEAQEALFRARFDRFLPDAIGLVGGDGSPLIQGRSLIYRFGTAAPFWTAALIGSETLSLGQLRHAGMAVVKHFVDQGVPDSRGVLSLGWFDEWPSLAQDYSGTGSPYWAAKGLLGLVLPADHPIWSAVEEPLPSEARDSTRVIEAPGWLVTSTKHDSIVRVYNHGTDHSCEGDELSDEPMYAGLAYSTRTFPLLRRTEGDLPDSAVVILDPAGRVSHRSGFKRLAAGSDGHAVFGFSRWTTRWMNIDPGQRDIAHGLRGTSTYGPVLTVGTVARAEWEVRLVQVSAGTSALDRAPAVTITGWPITGDDVTVSQDGHAEAGGLRSSIRCMAGGAPSGVQISPDATPLTGDTATPWLTVQSPAFGEWMAFLLQLSAADATAPPTAVIDSDGVRIRWADGLHTDIVLPSIGGDPS